VFLPWLLMCLGTLVPIGTSDARCGPVLLVVFVDQCNRVCFLLYLCCLCWFLAVWAFVACYVAVLALAVVVFWYNGRLCQLLVVVVVGCCSVSIQFLSWRSKFWFSFLKCCYWLVVLIWGLFDLLYCLARFWIVLCPRCMLEFVTVDVLVMSC
jgi:hypothetical protein